MKWGPTILTSGGAIALTIAYSLLSRPGEWQGRRGGKSHDTYGYDSHYCRIWNVTSVQIIGKWALRVANR